MAYARTLSRNAPGSQIAVVTFDGSARAVRPLTPVASLDGIIRAIREDGRFGDGTNLKAGLDAARKLLRNSSPGRERQVVVLTDGAHNVGSNPSSTKLISIATLEITGIGGSPNEVNETLLKSLASRRPDGTPRYRWIGDKDRLVQHYRTLAGRITRS